MATKIMMVWILAVLGHLLPSVVSIFHGYLGSRGLLTLRSIRVYLALFNRPASNVF